MLARPGFDGRALLDRLVDRFDLREQAEAKRIQQVIALVTDDGCQVNALVGVLRRDARPSRADIAATASVGSRSGFPTQRQRLRSTRSSISVHSRASLPRSPSRLGAPRQRARFLCGITSPATSESETDARSAVRRARGPSLRRRAGAGARARRRRICPARPEPRRRRTGRALAGRSRSRAPAQPQLTDQLGRVRQPEHADHPASGDLGREMLREGADAGTKLVRPLDREVAPEAREHARHPVERADAHAEQRLVTGLHEPGERRRDALRHGGRAEGRARPRPPTSTARSRASARRGRRRRSRSGAGAAGSVVNRAPRHPVDAERSQRGAAVVVRCEVPAARNGRRGRTGSARVGSAPPRTTCTRCEAGACVGSPRRAAALSRAATGTPAVAASVNASVASSASTRRRSVAGRTRWIFSSAASAGSAPASSPSRRAASEPEHDRDGLVVAQHQRRQPVAGPHAVAAADAALALDRDAELLQRVDVAPDRAPVDAEVIRDLASRDERPRLEQLEQLEQPGRSASASRSSEAQIEDGNRPICRVSSEAPVAMNATDGRTA